MLRRGAAALIAGSCLAAVSAIGGGASATPKGSVTITGEFVVYERSYSSSPDTNIGPFDHHAVFHPGGVGPSGQVCSPDRVNVAKNEITLTFDPAGGPVAGSGVLDMSCEYHPGCGWVDRTEEVTFTGQFAPDERLLTGGVAFTMSGGETTSWGTGSDDYVGCLESTWVQEPMSFTATWLFDLDANLGYVTSNLCVDDPVKRIGWFTMTDGVGLVGPSVARVATDDMATPRCVVPAAVDEGAGNHGPEYLSEGRHVIVRDPPRQLQKVRRYGRPVLQAGEDFPDSRHRGPLPYHETDLDPPAEGHHDPGADVRRRTLDGVGERLVDG